MSFHGLRQRVTKYLTAGIRRSGRGAGRAFQAVHRYRPSAEVLEDRTAPAAFTWINTTPGVLEALHGPGRRIN
jgi:hypothetical protein